MSIWGLDAHEDLRLHIEDLEQRLSLTERRLDVALKWAERALDEVHERKLKRGPDGRPKAKRVVLTPEYLEKVMELLRRSREEDQRSAEVLANADVVRRKLRARAGRGVSPP